MQDILSAPAIINGLPDNLRVVPEDADRWKLWAKAVLAYRIRKRREYEADVRVQHVENEKCARDPAYFACVYGIIFEPRSVDDRPPEWKPFIPFHFQVQLIRWIEHVLTQNKRGRGDGVIEKSRDMGATWIFCMFAVHHFLFEPVFICGFISRNADAVDKTKNTDTIFYKLRAMLGIEDAVAPDLRLPTGMKPKGFNKRDHAVSFAIENPAEGQTCYLLGETTTKLAGVSGRSTMRVNDEGARFDAFEDAWANQQATTDHRFVLSSADLRFGPGFYDLARSGEKAAVNPAMYGPSFIRLDTRLHPFHDEDWLENERARASDIHKFNREYLMDYFAGQGDVVYPKAKMIDAEELHYDPAGGPVYCFVDNGVRDPAAFIWVQKNLKTNTYDVIYAFEGQGGEDARFYASVLCGVYSSGELQYDYDQYPGIHEIMAFTADLKRPVQYFGDPAGNNAIGDGKRTWYTLVGESVKELSGRTFYVNTARSTINTKLGKFVNAVTHEARKEAVNAMLPKFRFNNNEGGQRVLFCLQNSKYRDRKRASEAKEPMAPMHDDKSHTRTSFEFGCINLELNEKAGTREAVVAGNTKMVRSKVGAVQKQPRMW